MIFSKMKLVEKMNKYLIGSLIIILGLISFFPCDASVENSKPNVTLILVDDLKPALGGVERNWSFRRNC